MKLFKNIIIPLIFGTIIGLLSGLNNNYDNFIKPDIMPPNIVFPIVWTILYILMGVSSYIIYEETNEIPKIYLIQLVVNLLWSFIFFEFKLYLLAYLWIILLIVLVSIMIIKFIRINKLAGYLQIPYIIWLLIASFINLMFII